MNPKDTIQELLSFIESERAKSKEEKRKVKEFEDKMFYDGMEAAYVDVRRWLLTKTA